MANFIKIFSLFIISLFVSLIYYFGLLTYRLLEETRYSFSIAWCLFACIVLVIALLFLLEKKSKIIIYQFAFFLCFFIPLLNALLPETFKVKEHFAGIRFYNQEYIDGDYYCAIDCAVTNEYIQEYSENKKNSKFVIERYYYSYKEAELLGRVSFNDECCFKRNVSFNSSLISNILFLPGAVFEKFFYYLVNCILPILLICTLISWKLSTFLGIDTISLKKISLVAFSILVLMILFNVIYLLQIQKF